MHASRALLLQRREESQRHLRELGALPAQSQKMFEKKNAKQLMKLLQETKKRLKTFGNVNKKAIDQWTYFRDQREALQTRKAECDASEQAIEDLIRALDEKKDAAIERTVKMVAKSFAELFGELTNQGSAQLVMLKRAAVRAEGEEEEEEEGELAQQQYRGIDLKVSFTLSGQPQRMHQLSGGQQSLVALALIFAIQRCDPAPFYIFDEIDAALDDTHRLRVAEMIERQSESTQFIMTSHRPELIQHAHKHYLIQVRPRFPCQIVSHDASS